MLLENIEFIWLQMFFPEGVKKVGLFLSGGTDSALILYHLAMKDIEVFPVHGYAVGTPDINSVQSANEVQNWILMRTGLDGTLKVHLHDIFIHPMDYKDKSKYYYMKPARLYHEQMFGVTHWMFGTTRGMPDSPRPELRDDRNDTVTPPSEWSDIISPWALHDKKHIAKQYKELDILGLSNKTNSCIASSDEPCRVCWWCKERYWAFNSFDGGVQ